MDPQKHAQGHRNRLRSRFLQGEEKAVTDYELLELVLFSANPRADVKPLAKSLIQSCGSLEAVFKTDLKELSKKPGVTPSVLAAIRATFVISSLLSKSKLSQEAIKISTYQNVIDYCHLQMDHLKVEQLRLLFLDRKNKLLTDEIQQQGTVDQAPIYVREIVKRCLEVGASSLILVHNHPSGDPTPSRADIDMTRKVKEAVDTINVSLFDHVIIGKGKHVSLRAENLI